MNLNLPRNAGGTINAPDIGVGGTLSFTVTFAPPVETDLGFHQDIITITGDNAQADFELISEPELNILTYRYNPATVQAVLETASAELATQINTFLDQINRELQKRQRANGKTFVSRTSLTPTRYAGTRITVFRVVLANPLTTDELLGEVLNEQRSITLQGPIPTLLAELEALVKS